MKFDETTITCVMLDRALEEMDSSSPEGQALHQEPLAGTTNAGQSPDENSSRTTIPVDLVQGGRGVIARYPIHAGRNNAFIGIASAVIDLDRLLDNSGFGKDLKVAVSLSSRPHVGGEARTFFSTATPVDADPVVMTIDIGHEAWTMSAAPLGGWRQPSADLTLFRTGNPSANPAERSRHIVSGDRRKAGTSRD